MCQCPPTGRTHFYAIVVAMGAILGIGVNALQRAALISTGIMFSATVAMIGVNALQRAALISTGGNSLLRT